MKVSSTLVLLSGAALVAARATSGNTIASRQIAAVNQLQARTILKDVCGKPKNDTLIEATKACEFITTFAINVLADLSLGNLAPVAGEPETKWILENQFPQITYDFKSINAVKYALTTAKYECINYRNSPNVFITCVATHEECAKNGELYEKGEEVLEKGSTTHICPALFSRSRGRTLCGNYQPLTLYFIRKALKKHFDSPPPGLPKEVTLENMMSFLKTTQALFCDHKASYFLIAQPVSVYQIDKREMISQSYDYKQVQALFKGAVADPATFKKKVDSLLKAADELSVENNNAFLEAMKADAKQADILAQEKADEKKKQDQLLIDKGSEAGRTEAEAKYNATLADIAANYTQELKIAKDNHTKKYEQLEKESNEAVEAEKKKIEALKGNITALAEEKKTIEEKSSETTLELDKAKDELKIAIENFDKADKELSDKDQQIKELGEDLAAERLHRELRIKTDAEKSVDELQKKVRFLENQLNDAEETLHKIGSAIRGNYGGRGGDGGSSNDVDEHGRDRDLDMFKPTDAHRGYDAKYPDEDIFDDDSEDCIEEDDEDNGAIDPRRGDVGNMYHSSRGN